MNTNSIQAMDSNKYKKCLCYIIGTYVNNNNMSVLKNISCLQRNG